MCVDVPGVLGEAGKDVELSLWFDVSVEADRTECPVRVRDVRGPAVRLSPASRHAESSPFSLL